MSDMITAAANSIRSAWVAIHGLKERCPVDDILAQLADAKAAQAMVVERAADMIEDNVRHAKELGREIWAMPDLRALAPASGVEALAALRAERDEAFRCAMMRRERLDVAEAEVSDLRARLAAAEAQVGALRLQLDQKDALYDSGFQAGVKLGWNFGVSGDEAGFQAATSSTEHVAELKRIRAALAEVQARDEGGGC